MPRTPDRIPGEADEEGIILEERVDDPVQLGGVRYVSGDFRMKDSAGVFNPRTGGTGLTANEHKTLRQLIHFIDDGPAEGFPTGCYKETLPVGPFPTSEIWYESVAKAKKIVELTITRNANKTPAAEVWEMYDIDGSTVLTTVTDTISYSAVFETSRTRAIA